MSTKITEPIQPSEEYPVEPAHHNVEGRPIHGNTKRGLPFHKMKIGDSFVVPKSDFNRTSCARFHYRKRVLEKEGRWIEIVSYIDRDYRTGKPIVKDGQVQVRFERTK
jgi:hypothetical protein